MTLTEVGHLLKEISSLDPRFGIPSEEKVKAWTKAINPNLTFDNAIDYIVKHYSYSEKTLMPADLNSYYRTEKNNKSFIPTIVTEIPKNQQWRKMVALDLEAKVKLEKGLEYIPSTGNPWRHPMGSGKYAEEAISKGIQLKGQDILLADGFNSL